MLKTKKTFPIATVGAALLALGTVGIAPATAALFRLNVDFNDSSHLSITYDGDILGTVGDNFVSYQGAIVDLSFVSPAFSVSLANLGTLTSDQTSILNDPYTGGQDIFNYLDGVTLDGKNFLIASGLVLPGDVFVPLKPTSLQTEASGSLINFDLGTPNFGLIIDDNLVFIENNSGGKFKIGPVPIASTPEPVVPWWVAGALVGGWWLRGLRVGRKQ